MGKTPHFRSTTRLDGKCVGSAELADPFLVSLTHVSWRDLLLGLLKGGLTLKVEVDACPAMTKAVMRLTQLSEEELASFNGDDEPAIWETITKEKTT